MWHITKELNQTENQWHYIQKRSGERWRLCHGLKLHSARDLAKPMPITVVRLHNTIPARNHVIANDFIFKIDNTHTRWKEKHTIEYLMNILTGNGGKGSQHPAKSFECHSKSLEYYSWRLIKEMTRKLTKTVPTVLKNKSGDSKYWLSDSLELYKLCFCLICCISV